MLGPTYRAALKAGVVMAGGALAEVVESRSSALKPKDLVFGDTGWREYAVVPATSVMKVMPREPLSHAVSVYGIAGLTAYFGLLECGRPKGGGNRCGLRGGRLIPLARRADRAHQGLPRRRHCRRR